MRIQLIQLDCKNFGDVAMFFAHNRAPRESLQKLQLPPEKLR